MNKQVSQPNKIIPYTPQERETLIKLKLLGSVKIGEKINTRYLIIMADSFTTKVSRYLYGENRSNTVIFCRNTIFQSLELLKNQSEQKSKTLILEDINSAKLGLQNLQETYSSDIRVHSELQEIIQSINV